MTNQSGNNKKYKSCHILKHGMCFFGQYISSCCFSPVDQIDNQTPPLLCDLSSGERYSTDLLFERIENYDKTFREGGCPRECANCYHIEEKDWSDDDKKGQYIDYITITHFTKCSANCIYCSNNNTLQERKNNTYKIVPILNDLKEKGLIKKHCELHIGGGEFTIYDECEELLNLYAVNDFARVFVPTNAIKYSETLFQAMDKATTYIIVSLDCGSRKLYKRIKRVDAFDKVIENLTMYAKTKKSQDAIRLKYIILPTVNDNISEFKRFLRVAKKLKVQNLIIDIDARYARMNNWKIDDFYINLAKKMNNIALKQGFITEFYSFFFQCEKGTKIKTYNLIEDFIETIKFKYFNKNSNKISALYNNEKVHFHTK